MRRPTLAGEVHVWRATLDSGHWPAATGLPSEERTRAARLTGPHRRRRWVASRWALRAVLGRYLDADPAGIELRPQQHGKPALADRAQGLRFNLGHSGGLALIAVAEEREVGVDVERIDPRRDPVRLAERALDPATATAIRSAPADRRQALFHQAWTRREAIVKCHGIGLRRPLPPDPVFARDLDPGSGFAAALAVAGRSMPPLRLFALKIQRIDFTARV